MFVSRDSEVLLIEDDPNDAEMIMRTLKKNGWDKKLKHVEDRAQAMQVLEELKQQGKSYPKLIILDLSIL